MCWRLLYSCCAINAVVPAVPVQPLTRLVHSQRSVLQEKDIASVVVGNGARPLSVAEVPGMTLYPGRSKQAGAQLVRCATSSQLRCPGASVRALSWMHHPLQACDNTDVGP
jgi:hypothetical protein